MEEHTECIVSCHSLFSLVVCGLWRRALLSYLPAGDRHVPPEWNSLEPHQEGRSYKTSLSSWALASDGLRVACCAHSERVGHPGFGRHLSPRGQGSPDPTLCTGVWTASGSCCSQHHCESVTSTPPFPPHHLVLALCPDPHLRDEDTPPLGVDQVFSVTAPDQPSPHLSPGLAESSLFTARTALGP